MKFGVQFKTQDLGHGGGYTNGMTMIDNGDILGGQLVSETPEKTTFKSFFGCVAEGYHKDIGGVTECYTVFTNTLERPVTLEMLASFSLEDIEADIIHRATSFWSAEGKILSQKLLDLNMERSWAYNGMRLEKFGQVGSMPVRKWFPFLVLENSATGEFTGIQLYCASSWQMEIYKTADPVRVVGGLADYDFGHWSKTIQPGESFTSPKAVIATGKSLLEVCDKLVKAQKPRISEVDKDMPVIFNEYCTTWGNPTRENLEKIAKRIDGSGIKYLVIDAGWYKEEGRNWDRSIGEWIPNKELFPNGIKEVADMIKSHGMIPGLWFELENVACESSSFELNEHQQTRFGVPITAGSRRFWNMRDPWVQEYLTERVIGTLKDNGFGYIKVDYNENIGVGCDGAESLGEGLRQSVVCTQDFFRKMAKEMPRLVIENCSSGGHRLEPSMMELCSQASFSDAHECTCIPVIAANVQRLIRPEQSQIWAVLRKNDDIHRTRYSLIAGFLGRLCLSGDVFDVPEENWQEALDAIALYDRAKDIIRDGCTKEIRCTTQSYTNPTGYQAVLRTLGDRALLIVHTFEGGANPDIDDLLNGYTVTESFGSDLDGDFRAKLYLLKK